jgi:hypothetical protein
VNTNPQWAVRPREKMSVKLNPCPLNEGQCNVNRLSTVNRFDLGRNKFKKTLGSLLSDVVKL